MNLGENIYRFRTQRNMSQGDLADALDVFRQSVSKWENNSATPELEKLIRMSQLFGITLDELVNNQSPAPQPQHLHPETPTHEPISIHRIIGIIFLCFGLLFLLVVMFLNGVFWGYLIGIPLIISGIICLVCRDHILFRSFWGIFTIHAPVFLLSSIYFINRRYAYVLVALLLVFFAILIIWTITGSLKGTLSRSSQIAAIICATIVILSSAVILINTSRIVHYDDLHSVEETFIPSKISSD